MFLTFKLKGGLCQSLETCLYHTTVHDFKVRHLFILHEKLIDSLIFFRETDYNDRHITILAVFFDPLKIACKALYSLSFARIIDKEEAISFVEGRLGNFCNRTVRV